MGFQRIVMNGCSVDCGMPTEAQRNLIKQRKELVSPTVTNLGSGLGSGWPFIQSSTLGNPCFFHGTDSQIGDIFLLCCCFGD